MDASKLGLLGKQGLLILAVVSLTGGFKAVSNFIRVADAVVAEPQTTSNADAHSGSTTEFLVCSEARSWQRPTLEQQQKQLANDDRYGDLLQNKEFQQLADQFWRHDVLSFTTYGLSARMEPINLSGLWALTSDMWENCYSHNEGNAINEGTLAETWLLHYQIVDLQWQNNHYVMTVEPSRQGMQVVQFERRESETNLPLTVITPQGVAVDIHNADW